MCPCRAFNECFFLCFFYSSDIWGFVFFEDIWGLRQPIFSSEKKTNIRKRLGKGTFNTRAEVQGLTLKNGVDIWTFVRVSAKIMAWHCNYLVLVYTSKYSNLNIDLLLVLRSQFFEFVSKTLYKHVLEHLGAAGPEKKKVSFFCSSYSKCLPIFDLVEGLRLVGTHLRC